MCVDVVRLAEAILKKIDDEQDPLRCSLHYREAADILPEMIQVIKDYRKLTATRLGGGE